MKHIKSITEFFDPGVFGDSPGYGGANGVFRISYKPFKDLSVSVGPDPNVPRIIQGAQYQVGDLVVGQPIGGKKDERVAGMIVKSYLAEDGKSYRYDIMIQSVGDHDQKVVELNPETIQFLNDGDKGHKEVLTKYSVANLQADIYNSPTVYNDPELGIERISP